MHSTEKKSPLRWLLPAVILLAAAVTVFVVLQGHVLLGGHLYRKDSTELDLRGESLSAEQYEKLASALPQCRILWSVPFGSERVDCTATEAAVGTLTAENLADLRYCTALQALDATASVLTAADYERICTILPDCAVTWSVPIGSSRVSSTAENAELTDFDASELSMFGYLPRLKTADCRSCECYDAILALKEMYPSLEVLWQVPVSGEYYLQDASEIRVDSARTSASELKELLCYLPAAELVSCPGCTYSDEEQDMLRDAYPDIVFRWPFRMGGTSYDGSETTLSCAGMTITEEQYAEMLRKLGYFTALETLDMTGCNLTDEQVFALADQCPEADLIWDFEVMGVPINTMDELVDFSGIEMTDTEAVEAMLPYMHHLTKVDMSDCGFSDEVMDGLNKKYENVRFVWTLHITRYSIRTDTIAFRATVDTHGYFDGDSVMRLQYCTDMVCLDLGHRPIETLDFLYSMPHIKYLLLLDCRSNDLTPIGSLKELKFLELNRATAASLKPLLNCPSLQDLNITFLYTSDGETYGQVPDIYETLMELDWVNRVWWSLGQMTDEQAAALQEAHPDILYKEAFDWNSSNQDPWRYCKNYYDMRDMLGGPENGVYYMNGTGVIHYKIVDGVTYGEDEPIPDDVD